MRWFIAFICLWCSFVQAQSCHTTTSTLFDEETQQIRAKFTYSEDRILSRVFNHYDENGRLCKTIVDNGTSDLPSSLEGVTERLFTYYTPHPAIEDDEHPIEVVEKCFNPATGEETTLKKTVNTYNNYLLIEKRVVTDGQGHKIETEYDERGKIAFTIETRPNFLPRKTQFYWDDEGRLIDTICNVIESPLGNVDKLKHNEESKHSQWLGEFEQPFESFAEEVMGTTYFRLSGYYSFPATSGVFGNGEVNDKVRITLINGMLNHPEDRMVNLSTFSNLHGGCNIHYILRPFEGYSRDMLRGFVAKLGFHTEQAKLLAATWKKLIAEMGGLKGGGLIIHYAHSIGGTETDNAKSLMTPEELKMIRVYTIGSPTLIPDGEFAKVVNYVSRQDGICFLDPVDYVKGLIDPDTNVVYLASLIGVPFIDHLLSHDTYKAVVEVLGGNFVETYFKDIE